MTAASSGPAGDPFRSWLSMSLSREPLSLTRLQRLLRPPLFGSFLPVVDPADLPRMDYWSLPLNPTVSSEQCSRLKLEPVREPCSSRMTSLVGVT